MVGSLGIWIHPQRAQYGRIMFGSLFFLFGAFRPRGKDRTVAVAPTKPTTLLAQVFSLSKGHAEADVFQPRRIDRLIDSIPQTERAQCAVVQAV